MRDIEEIKSILKKHKSELKKKYKVKEIGIFGSFIRGEEDKNSDIDILADYHEVPDLILLWILRSIFRNYLN